jgi:hypothetical protein
VQSAVPAETKDAFVHQFDGAAQSPWTDGNQIDVVCRNRILEGNTWWLMQFTGTA